MCIPMSSKFLTESTGEKIVKIGQYLAKIWTKYDSLVFLGHPVNINSFLYDLVSYNCNQPNF